MQAIFFSLNIQHIKKNKQLLGRVGLFLNTLFTAIIYNGAFIQLSKVAAAVLLKYCRLNPPTSYYKEPRVSDGMMKGTESQCFLVYLLGILLCTFYVSRIMVETFLFHTY